jgi:predicted RNA-binding Zn ribbon-like protein
MYITHDTEIALITATGLVNTARNGTEALTDPSALAAFLDDCNYSGFRAGTTEEWQSVRALRSRLRAVWDTSDRATAARIINGLLREANALPQLTDHDDWDWHLHFTDPDAPLVHRLGAEAAMGLADVIRHDDLDRLRHCAAPDCDAVLVDLSRNRSRRFCDTGNCGNRLAAAAYRARRGAGATKQERD